MNDADVSPLINVFILLLMFAALTAFLLWIRRWLKFGYVLPYEPRPRVAWGPVSGVLAVLMTGLGVVNGLAMRTHRDNPVNISAEDFAASQLVMSGMQLLLAVLIVAILITVSGASWCDLGLPSSLRQLGQDIRLGLWLGLASLVPVYVLQVAAIKLLDMPAAHPLLDSMAELPDPAVFAAAMLSAVIAAPVFEELVFRLLLQGGLEHWEDRRIAWPLSWPRQAHEAPPAAVSDNQPTVPHAEYAEVETVATNLDSASDSVVAEIAEKRKHSPQPPVGVGAVPPLGHGWICVLASSFLFALAHLGNGPSPIALFALAMMLGYAYQRTHRIVPCIVAHFLMNLISVTLLILMVTGT